MTVPVSFRLNGLSSPCRGDSMAGTLAAGDCVQVVPVAFDELVPGDVVLCKLAGRTVVHRIVGRDGSGLITRGDGNWGADTDRLTPENLMGLVVEREHLGRRMPVSGGALGLRRARIRRVGLWLRYQLGRMWAGPYALLVRSRCLRWCWAPRITAARFCIPGGGEITKYIHHGRTIARWFPRECKWECRKPYDLVLQPPDGP